MKFGTWSIRAASACGMGMVLMAAACSSESPDDCVPHPTFKLIVDAQAGPVPDDVRIHVRYGSGDELFDARDPAASSMNVFCALERKGQQDGGVDAADGGTAEGPIERVTCDLWTDGPATVTVTAQGYPELIRELEPDRDDKCGIILTESRITLEHEPLP